MAAATESNLFGCHDVTALQTETAMTKDKIFNWKFCLCCGLFIWFIINLLQGVFTEIHEDEAYYALYGEHLAWGYFDHPPMVGLMTFLSSHLFNGILGVRFFTIITSCLSLFVMWKIAQGMTLNSESVRLPQCDSPTLLLFFTIACSIVMFNIYGFVTTPDASLILFSALFLLVYQRYLEQNTWPRALLMGVLMACMVYSKYHAFLLLGLIVLSNLKLLKDGKFYMACLVALALLMPHIHWQVQADFPSFRYHLSERSDPFRWSYFLEYLPNQLLIFNPLTFGAVVYVLIPPASLKRGKRKSPERATRTDASSATLAFERGLRFIFMGFFFFFWLMTFRGHVEPHWTIVCMIPAVILVYRKTLIDEKLYKYIRHFVLPSLVIVLAVRIALLTPMASPFGFNHKEKHYHAIETIAGDRPVVFCGSFQQPALYHYFTGKESSALRCFYNRKTQYDLWQFDKDWAGKEVFVCGLVLDHSSVYQIDNEKFEGFLSEHFQSANRLTTRFTVDQRQNDKAHDFHHGDTLHLQFSIHNPYNYLIDFQDNMLDMQLLVLFPDLEKTVLCQYDPLPVLQPNETYHGRLQTVVNEDIAWGAHRLTLGIGDRMGVFMTDENEVEISIEDN